MPASGEEKFIATHLAELTDGFPGGFSLLDDCAELMPLPGHALVLKTDPVVEGVHFFGDDAPEDLAWKALAVNVSDLAAKGARPVAYLMALTFPERPNEEWMARFAAGLRAAQDAFGCVLIGGDTDRWPRSMKQGPLSVAITVIGEMLAGRMVRREGAQPGDLVYVSGELGGAALGLQLRFDPAFGCDWPLEDAHKELALARYLRPEPKLGLGAALRNHARSAMDISDGLLKDLDRMCRLTGTGAEIELQTLPLAAGVQAIMAADPAAGLPLITAGDDYEVLATAAPQDAAAFELAAKRGGVPVTCIGEIIREGGVRLMGPNGGRIKVNTTGYDHFDNK